MHFLRAFVLQMGVLLCSTVVCAQQKITKQFLFDTAIDVLNTAQSDSLLQFVKTLNEKRISAITILGYCDDRGTNAYNNELSARRANHVEQVLIAHGINNSKIVIVEGNGEISLQGNAAIATERERNRRVDLEITYVPKPVERSILSDSLKVGDKIVLEDILFENSRSLLLPESVPVLEKITAVIKEKRKYNIAILGHICCNPPGIDVKDFETGIFNLSHARAKVIYDYLVYKGVEARRLTFKGMKADYPLGKGEKADRRVELLITGIDNTRK